MVKGLFIPAEGSAPIEAREFAGLEDYQAAVGGWIEAADIPDLGVTVFVNEEGLIRQLPLNSRVTFLWWYHVPSSRQQAMLVGDAVVVGLPDRAGASTDLPDALNHLLDLSAQFVIESRADSGEWERHGDPRVYFDAVVCAMLLIARSGGEREVRVSLIT